MLGEMGAFELRYHNQSSVSMFAELYRENPAPIVAYGAGFWSGFNLALIEKNCAKAACLCDSDPRLEGATKLGYKIINPATLARNYRNAYVVISTWTEAAVEIHSNLLSMGFEREKIYWFTPLPLGDEQYFGPEFMKPKSNEVYVDLGCYNGDTIEGFVKFSKGSYKKIYGFEPHPDNYRKTQESVDSSGYKNVNLVNKGAWSRTCTLAFGRNSGSDAALHKDGSIKIPVTTVDEVAGGDAVTFIKMDVEGAELEALKGSARTIAKYAPKLAVCVYHKPQDILEIPLYINSLHSGYRFYLRHHTSSSLETVLYAVPFF